MFPEDHSFPTLLAHHAFKVVLQHFFTIFPANFDVALISDPELYMFNRYITPATINARVHALHALGYFLETKLATEIKFMTYIDKLFKFLLQSTTHPLYQAAVIHVLHSKLPLTAQNRLRVEQFFRPLIDNLASRTYQSSAEDVDPEGPPLPPKYIHRELDSFYSVWFTKASDSTVVSIKPSSENMNKLTEGYVSKRWAHLFQGSVALSNSKERTTVHISHQTRNNALKKGFKEPYPSYSRPYPALDVQFFEDKKPAEKEGKLAVLYRYLEVNLQTFSYIFRSF